MYQALLTRKYLTSKVMPLLASLAVVLCTAMVLITWSVMGGFLTMLLNSGRTLLGDVNVSWPSTGFAYYAELVDRLQKDDLVAGATPVIETYGLISLPDGRREAIVIKGIDGPGYAKVTEYDRTLWWRPIETALRKDKKRQDPRIADDTFWKGFDWKQFLDNGRKLQRRDEKSGEFKPAAVLGIEVSGFNSRRAEGYFEPRLPYRRTAKGDLEPTRVFAPSNMSVTLNLIPLDASGRTIDMISWSLPVANEVHSGIYETDNRVVFAPLNELQRKLHLDQGVKAERVSSGLGAHIEIDPATGEERIVTPQVVADDPARVTNVYVRAKDGISADELKKKVETIYAQFERDHAGKVPSPGDIKILTWEDQNRTMINAVKKETGLVLFIFSFISLTAVFLVLAIFWSMVSEKTKDVGILRAVGASRAGIAGVWLAYGVMIGVVGSGLGGALAYVVVKNINPIHEWLGETFNLYIWDPKIYYFSEVPSQMDASKAAIVLAGGIISSVLGALIPAVRAASMDPVKALRFE
ncbi:MAG: FtsX-like permease family protein [Phycisphaerales bacterium]